MLYPERGLDSLTQVVSGEVLRGGGCLQHLLSPARVESQEAW